MNKRLLLLVGVVWAVCRLALSVSPVGEKRLLLRMNEFAEMVALSRSQAYKIVNSGDVKACKIGRATRIPVAEAEDWVRRQAAKTGSDSGTPQ